MEEDDLVTAALGVLLTQVRSARRALEEVERNTSRYLGFEFARALTEGAGFGAPPMFQGALKVHVVNINDLAPGNSFGGFLQTVLGGIGNFVGGLLGGVVGGTLSAFALPDMIARMERITSTVSSIIDRLGVTRPSNDANRGGTTGPNLTPEQASTPETLATTMEGISGLVRNLTALFQVASTGPDDNASANAAGANAPVVLTQSGERWMAILHGVNTLLDRTKHIVNGLILLIPMVVGSIALLIGNLAGIRRALLETMQFILRNVLVLRGVILTTIFETVAAVARLAASIVTVLGTALQSALTSVIGVVSGLLDTAFDTLETLTNALQAVIRSLLQWLVNGVFNTLRAIGGLAIFRTIDHFMRILPSLLDPIYRIVVAYKGGSGGLPRGLRRQLRQSHRAAFATSNPGNTPGAALTGTPGTATNEQIIGEFPDLGAIIDPLGATLEGAVQATGAHLELAAQQTFDGASSTLGGLAGRFDRAVRDEAQFSQNVLSNHVDTLTQRADQLAATIAAPIKAQSAETGFEDIAEAYETWLTTGGGLNGILGMVGEHFQNSAESGGNGAATNLLRGQFDRPRASIEIGNVEIVIEQPETPAEAAPEDGVLGPGDFYEPDMSDEAIWQAWHRHNLEMEDRVISPDDLRAYIA